MPSVSVYLNNTSIGTITNEQGLFTINRIPSDKFRLVVSSIGYETYVNLIDPRRLPVELIITLKLKSEELKDIVLTPFEPDGWAKWGKLFTEIIYWHQPQFHSMSIGKSGSHQIQVKCG